MSESQDFTRDDILTVECKHAVHCPTPRYLLGQTQDDFHLVKEIVHLKDKRQIKRTRLVKNFKRPFFYTKEGFRNHKQKKETEHLSRLIKNECVQSQLQNRIVQALNLHHLAGQGIKRLFRSPYIYGADISSTTLMKERYLRHMEKVGVTPTKYTVAGLDIETDMETEEILMGTVSFKSDVLHIVDKAFLRGIADAEQRIHDMFQKHSQHLIESRGIELRVKIVDGPAEVLIEMIEQLHRWQPDFCSIWNIDFELPKFIATAQKYGIDMAQLCSDPSVPKPFRHFWYKVGARQKKTSSGKIMPKAMEEQWHTVITPASFQFVDAMAAFSANRAGQAKRQSYALARILEEEKTGVQKLSFPYIQAKTEDTGEWHVLMQQDYPIEYCVYNIHDPIVLEVLDEKTNDLAVTLPTFSKSSDLMNYASQPRRKIDEWYFEFLNNKQEVIGCASDQMRDELDAEIYDLAGWIITLQGWTDETGLSAIKELPDFKTNIRLFAGDLDVSSAYPTNTCILNVSRATTKSEMIGVEGVDPYTTRMQGLNLSGGMTNSVEFCRRMLGLPDTRKLYSAFEEDLANGNFSLMMQQNHINERKEEGVS